MNLTALAEYFEWTESRIQDTTKKTREVPRFCRPHSLWTLKLFDDK